MATSQDFGASFMGYGAVGNGFGQGGGDGAAGSSGQRDALAYLLDSGDGSAQADFGSFAAGDEDDEDDGWDAGDV